MRARSVRAHLQRAAGELERACETITEPSAERHLATVGEQLRYHAEETPRDPEAPVHPERGALDSMQRRISEAVEEVGDEAAIEHLRNAREELLLVVATLEEQWQKQHEVPGETE